MTHSSTDDSSQFGHENETKQKMEAELKHHYRFHKQEKIAGRYTVIAPLGFGGFAEVYHCLDEKLKLEVAVKVLIEERANLLDEARTVAQLEHPHIVQVREFDTLKSDNIPIVIYKYIPGHTLEDMLNQASYRRLTLDEKTFRIIEQIGQALDYAHQQGIIHRDIKPSNIIIDENGQAHLTDFGLASVKKGPEGASVLSTDVRQTLSGTLPYMAPEQLMEKSEGDQASDIYSLSVVVYEMLTGQLPYQGRDARLILNIANENVTPIPPTVANAELPPNLDKVLLQALNHAPERRHRSAGEFVADLRAVTADFAQANTQYQKAMELIEQKQWRETKAIFETLPQNFKDVKLRREQVEQKVRLLDLFAKAETQIEAEEFAAALETLDMLQQVDPDYDIHALRSRAVDGKATKDERTLLQQYEEAVRQFNTGEYQAALDTLDVIAKKQVDYPDPVKIRAQAQKEVDYQHELRQLYNKGVAYSRNEEWETALASFEELIRKEPGYEDAALRLATAQHFSELAGLLHSSEEKQVEGQYTDAIDLLDRIKQKNANYKKAEIASRRQGLVDALYEQCKQLVEAKVYADCLTYLSQLKEREPDYPELTELETAAHNGLARQEKLATLQQLYREAEEKLEARDFAGTLQLWQTIEEQKENLPLADTRLIVRGAKEGLYGEATAAVADKQPNRALDLWKQLQSFDADFEDRNDVVPKAQKQLQSAKRQRQVMFWGGSGIFLLLLIIFGKEMGIWPGTPTPTPTIDISGSETAVAAVTSTHTASPTLTPTLLPTSTITSSPTSTPTTDPTDTSTPEPTVRPSLAPANTAIALLSASIFAEPDENSEALTFVDPGESVIVLEMQDSWISVRNDEGIEGWAAANRFDIMLGVPTETPTATITPSATNTPGAITAAAVSSASIFAEPSINSAQITFIDTGTVVTVLGRSANNSWLFIRTFDETEGWVALSLMRYEGDVEQLPVRSDVVATPIGTTGSNASEAEQGLTFDFWHLPGQFNCTASGWTQALFMEGHGGDGSYTYFIYGQKVAGPMSNSFSYQLSGSGTSTVQVPGRVESGDGQTREIILFVPAPDCS